MKFVVVPDARRQTNENSQQGEEAVVASGSGAPEWVDEKQGEMGEPSDVETATEGTYAVPGVPQTGGPGQAAAGPDQPGGNGEGGFDNPPGFSQDEEDNPPPPPPEDELPPASVDRRRAYAPYQPGGRGNHQPRHRDEKPYPPKDWKPPSSRGSVAGDPDDWGPVSSRGSNAPPGGRDLDDWGPPSSRGSNAPPSGRDLDDWGPPPRRQSAPWNPRGSYPPSSPSSSYPPPNPNPYKSFDGRGQYENDHRGPPSSQFLRDQQRRRGPPQHRSPPQRPSQAAPPPSAPPSQQSAVEKILNQRISELQQEVRNLKNELRNVKEEHAEEKKAMTRQFAEERKRAAHQLDIVNMSCTASEAKVANAKLGLEEAEARAASAEKRASKVDLDFCKAQNRVLHLEDILKAKGIPVPPADKWHEEQKLDHPRQPRQQNARQRQRPTLQLTKKVPQRRIAAPRFQTPFPLPPSDERQCPSLPPPRSENDPFARAHTVSSSKTRMSMASKSSGRSRQIPTRRGPAFWAKKKKKPKTGKNAVSGWDSPEEED